jgi:hypothetical protein
MNRTSTCTTTLLGVGILMWTCTGLPYPAAGEEKDSDVHDAVAEWHIRLRGTKA